MATPSTKTDQPSEPEVDLRDARLAAVLAWLVPGLGHLYQRRTGKGLLFMICILGAFAYGMYLGEGRVVYASTTNPIGEFGKFKERWHYAGQLGVGLVALPAYIQTWRVESGDAPLFAERENFLFERPPYTHAEAVRFFGEKLNRQQLELQFFRTQDDSGNFVHHPSEREKWHHDLGFRYELGTVYTLIAGLLNVLAICDARWGPLVTHHNQKPRSQDQKKDQKRKESPDDTGA